MILDKIRKLRALATSSNVHEAAAAAAAAERLIQEHNLSEAELQTEEDVPVTREDTATFGKHVANWQSNLLFHLGRAYQCSGFYARTGNGFVFRCYGRPQDIETLRYQYAFFTAEITRLAASQCKGQGRTYHNSFRLGAVKAIGEALKTANHDARKQATSSALVVVDQRADLAKATRDKENPDLRNSSGGSSNINGQAYAAGQRAGANINQRTAIGQGGTRLLR
jgi:hypothetical protein